MPSRVPIPGARRTFPAAAALFAAITIAIVAGGCGALGRLEFVKRRLPPPSPVAGGILFQFSSPSAHVVQVAGSWPENDWLRGQAETARYDLGRMDDPDGDGIWTIVVDLPPGRYQYKFRVDETNWKEDPNNPQKLDDGFGGFNSLLVVN